MTVFIYVNTSKQVGDADHLKVFANADAAETWFEENDPEGGGSNMRFWSEPHRPPHHHVHDAARTSSLDDLQFINDRLTALARISMADQTGRDLDPDKCGACVAHARKITGTTEYQMQLSRNKITSRARSHQQRG